MTFEKLLTMQQMCELLQVSHQTLYRMMGEGMPYLRAHRQRRFRYSEVLAWMEARDDTRTRSPE